MVISADQKWRSVPSRLVKTFCAGTSWPSGVKPVEVAHQAQVLPAALPLPGQQPLQRRARHDHQRHFLADVVGVAVPGVEQIGAHRARPLALRAEHIAVGDQGLLVAEQAGQVGFTVLGHEAIAVRHRGARRQGAALSGDSLDVAAQLDLLGQQSDAGDAVFSALARNADRALARQFVGRRQGFSLDVHRMILRAENVAHHYDPGCGQIPTGASQKIARRWGWTRTPWPTI
ncbi:MAG: hypothetical protein WDM85_11965 [Caulobacteraceae bacterium]